MSQDEMEVQTGDLSTDCVCLCFFINKVSSISNRELPHLVYESNCCGCVRRSVGDSRVRATILLRPFLQLTLNNAGTWIIVISG